MSRRYKQGTARNQEALLPPRIEDYVGEDNTVRAIDAYVDTLNLKALGFQNAGGKLTCGQPAFAPAALLKLYLVGYLNRVHSSRRLARECRRNLEIIWLLEGLTPGYRSIAEFRKLHGKALQAANKEFVLLCKELNLLGGEVVALDGAFFNASASDNSILTKTRLEKDLKQIEANISAYYQDLDVQDAAEQSSPDELGEAADLTEKLMQLKARQVRKQAQLKVLEDTAQTQLSHTDPDARFLRKAGQQMVGYNVQSVVDEKHKLIIHHEVTHAGNDSAQLSTQSLAAKEILGVDTLTVLADGGYYGEKELAACKAAKITAYVPAPNKHPALTEDGRLSGAQFHYNPEQNAYVCPAGELLRPRGEPVDYGGVRRTCYTRPKRACQSCPLKDACLPPKTARREIWRSEHAELIEAHRLRMEQEGADRMKRRAATVEHPFGTLKCWFGWLHFLVRGFAKVRGEMSLMVLGYNLTRVINILGVEAFRKLCAQRRMSALAA